MGAAEGLQPVGQGGGQLLRVRTEIGEHGTYFDLILAETALAAFIERHRPSAHIREMPDHGFRIEGQTIIIFEIRPTRA